MVQATLQNGVSALANGVSKLNGHVNGFSKSNSSSISNSAFSTYKKVEDFKSNRSSSVIVDGQHLSIADVVAVALHGTKVELSESARSGVEASVAFLEERKHLSIYGVTTGFGGSADTRTSDTMALQVSLLEHQLCGFLPSSGSWEEMTLHAMPRHIVRGAMVIRANSLARGHSGVRWKVLQALLDFLNLGLVPCVPLRGSISASGDLSPLSYIAGSICGHPSIKVFDTNTKQILSAPEALLKYNCEKITLHAKEGLGLVNGTAVSASAGALALYQAEVLAAVTQTVTAMTVEAMIGQVGSFDKFISDVARPHPGQIAVSKNVRHMLNGSKMAIEEHAEIAIKDDVGVLRQDRYALRTSPQWLGPQLESLELARKQIENELNSTTDNPLLDVQGNKHHHGGNFQAMAVTQAMEVTRQVLQNFGKLSFSQMTELVNCTMNRGLPSNLAGDEPSTNYHCKGLDIHAAAYTSELGFLANPVSSHVQSTEMHNQSVNSLALISARKTMESNDILSLLLSTHLYCASQAIDLRLFQIKFQNNQTELLSAITAKHFGQFFTQTQLKGLHTTLVVSLIKRLEETTSWDTVSRFDDLAKHLVGVIVDALTACTKSTDGYLAISAWKEEFSTKSAELYTTLRAKVFASPAASLEAAKQNMGNTFAVYECVRSELGISARRGDVAEGKHGPSVGTSISKIVEAMRDGRLTAAMNVMLAA